MKIAQTLPDGSVREIEDRGNIILYGTGLLNNFKLPDIEGLDNFAGRVIHTAGWPRDYNAEKWKFDRVAIIGAGASSVQLVPAMQPQVKRMDVFVRSGVWFVNIPSKYPQDYKYTTAETENFKKNPETLVAHAKQIENGLGGFFPMMFKGSSAQTRGKKEILMRMTDHIKDKRLLEGFIPKWSVGCKRPNPGDPYMRCDCLTPCLMIHR